MATFTVAPSNWNDPVFWSGLSNANGHTLDLSALGPGFSVALTVTPELLTLSDGTQTFTVGNAGDTSTDAALGSGTISNFDRRVWLRDRSRLKSSLSPRYVYAVLQAVRTKLPIRRPNMQ